MPILLFFVALAIVVILGFIIRMAMHPVDTLIVAVRIISFLIAALVWILFFVTFSDPSGAEWGLLLFAVPATLVWFGTFALRR